jgi:hypothetical protein
MYTQRRKKYMLNNFQLSKFNMCPWISIRYKLVKLFKSNILIYLLKKVVLLCLDVILNFDVIIFGSFVVITILLVFWLITVF